MIQEMNLDEHGLPVQSDGDNRDQLQRCGMIATAAVLTHTKIDPRVLNGIESKLQQSPGVYTRYVGGSPDNVSADQLIPIIAFFVAAGKSEPLSHLFYRMLFRFGFAQNYRDGLNANRAVKIPDFMLFRAAPLFSRASKWLYPLTCVADLYLLLMATTSCLNRHPDRVDDNNLIVTLAVCQFRQPTPLSFAASRFYTRFRAPNLGCVDGEVSSVNGALRHYHRAEAGGNPEIAELWRPIVDRLLT